MNIDVLKSGGIDYESGVARFMGDSALYEQVLGMFPESDCLFRGEAALAAGDYGALFESMHELKGVSGNLDFPALYFDCSQIVELLRGGCEDRAALEPLFHSVKASFNALCRCIHEAE